MSRSDHQAESSVKTSRCLEPLPGTYALLLSSTNDRLLQVGQIGQLHVRSGFYVYIGSAFGPGGVRARIAHHGKPSQHPHWHIDYLRKVTQLSEIWWTHDPIRREHQWAVLFGHMRGSSIPLAGFGSSDCTCVSHLYFFTQPPSFAAFHKHWQRHVQEVSLDTTVALKAPRRLLWRHSSVPQSTSFRHALGKTR